MIEYKDVDSKEKAYWLGFLMADGSITIPELSKICMSLKSTDLEHLEKFHKFTGTKAKIRIRRRERAGSITESAELAIGSQKLYKELVNLGITQKKSSLGTFINMDLIDSYFHRYVYLGYFDGDGHINPKDGNSVWCFNGENYIQFAQFLKSLGLDWYKLYKIPTKVGVGLTKLRINRQLTNTLLEYLYEDAPVYLERKYMTFIQSRQNKQKTLYYWNEEGNIVRSTTSINLKPITFKNLKNGKD